MGRGRPKGYKMSDESKAKIKETWAQKKRERDSVVKKNETATEEFTPTK